MAALSFQRKVLILGVCIAVLAGTYILGFVFSPARVGRREAETVLIAGFDRQLRDRVAEIRISSEKGKLELAKRTDRKSTRLNSSHMSISYAVFCLKKKKQQKP